MANTKCIQICGTIPYNCTENEETLRLLGQLNAPSFGLKISYGQQKFVPNMDLDPNTPFTSGKTAVYDFVIQGNEAVSNKWIRWAILALKACFGTVDEVTVFDIDNSNELKFEF